MKAINSEYVGRFGEKVCARYLKKLGYRLVEKNYRINRLETDIIATNKTHLIFVEVKTRRTDLNNLLRPAAAVDVSKRENLVSFARAYTKRLPSKHASKQQRIDVCEVFVHQKGNKLSVDELNYIENAVSR